MFQHLTQNTTRYASSPITTQIQQQQFSPTRINERICDIPYAASFEEVKKHWFIGDATQKLYTPLSEWSKDMRNPKSQSARFLKKIKSVYSRRKLVMDEYELLGDVDFRTNY